MDPDLEHDDPLIDDEWAAPDPAAVVRAVAECLRHLAHGYGLLTNEREACVALLQGPLPGVSSVDLAAAGRIIKRAGQRRLSARTRDRASALAVRLAELSAGGVRPS